MTFKSHKSENSSESVSLTKFKVSTSNRPLYTRLQRTPKSRNREDCSFLQIKKDQTSFPKIFESKLNLKDKVYNKKSKNDIDSFDNSDISSKLRESDSSSREEDLSKTFYLHDQLKSLKQSRTIKKQNNFETIKNKRIRAKSSLRRETHIKNGKLTPIKMINFNKSFNHYR